MNRAQRRQQARSFMTTNKKPTYRMKPKDYMAMKKKAVTEGVDNALVLLLSIPVKVLSEKYGWTETEELPDFVEHMINEYESFSNGDITLEEYQELVYQKCGVKFERTR